MNKAQYRNRIITAMKGAGTHRKTTYNQVIATLADILAERDRIYKQYISEGAQPLVVITSDRGAENRRQNPLLRQWIDLNTAALAYWRDLGLTPAGLKKLTDENMKQKKETTLESILSKLE